MEIVEIFGFQSGIYNKIPLFTMSITAGIPVPVNSDTKSEVDLNDFLIEHPTATFFAKVKGDGMQDIGICNGDFLIVDTSLEPKDKKVVVVSIQGVLTVKIYRVIEGEIFLQSNSNQYLPLKIEPYMEFVLIGVVTKIIHSL